MERGTASTALLEQWLAYWLDNTRLNFIFCWLCIM